MTRAELVKLINTAYDFVNVTDINFVDVKKSDTFYLDIQIAVAAGYTNGVGGNKFNPKEKVTREEIITMVSRILDLTANTYDGLVNLYKDGKEVSEWAISSFGNLIHMDYIVGSDNKELMPKKNMSLAEVVTFLDRTLKYDIVKSYTQPGKYGPLKDKETIEGSVEITRPGIVLQNTIIKGDLIVRESVGDGDVTFKNVEVEGTVYVYGGGENSINFEDVIIIRVIVLKKDNKVRLVARGATIIHETILRSGARIEEVNLTSSGFNSVELAENILPSSEVILLGNFDKLDINAKNAIVNLLKGTRVQNVVISKEAANAVIDVSAGSKILYVVVNAPASITGDGSVTDMKSTVPSSSIKIGPTIKKPKDTSGSNKTKSPDKDDSSPSKKGQATPTGLLGVPPTSALVKDGKITGVDNTMEYRMKNSTDWISISGTEITNISAGSYEVRYKAKEGYNAGSIAEVIVPAYKPEVSKYKFTMDIPEEIIVGEEVTIPVTFETSVLGEAGLDNVEFGFYSYYSGDAIFSIVDAKGIEHELEDDQGNWEPACGSSIPANYTEKMSLKATFNDKGIYEIEIYLADKDNPYPSITSTEVDIDVTMTDLLTYVNGAFAKPNEEFTIPITVKGTVTSLDKDDRIRLYAVMDEDEGITFGEGMEYYTVDDSYFVTWGSEEGFFAKDIDYVNGEIFNLIVSIKELGVYDVEFYVYNLTKHEFYASSYVSVYIYEESPVKDFVCEDGVITEYTGEDIVVTVPSSINGEEVKAIGNSAFVYDNSLTHLIIPNTIVSIGEEAFKGRYNLESINFLEGSKLKYIGDGAFSLCVRLSGITIPNTVVSIGDSAFEMCEAMTTLNF